MTVAAVMPLPEGVPELAFAGALGGRRVPLVAPACRARRFMPRPTSSSPARSTRRARCPKGRSATTSATTRRSTTFRCCTVEKVYHRDGAIWPFTVVGRPPQEDTSFGEFIHELTGPIIPTVIPGVHGVHAVDAAGVHPLLLALGSERYMPYADVAPSARVAHAGQRDSRPRADVAGEVSAHRGERRRPALDVHDIGGVSSARAASASIGGAICTFKRKRRSTRSTTAARGLNEGSKVVMAAVGPAMRELPTTLSDATRAN